MWFYIDGFSFRLEWPSCPLRIVKRKAVQFICVLKNSDVVIRVVVIKKLGFTSPENELISRDSVTHGNKRLSDFFLYSLNTLRSGVFLFTIFHCSSS